MIFQIVEIAPSTKNSFHNILKFFVILFLILFKADFAPTVNSVV